MSVETSTDSPVSVERFARVFVKGPEELPSNADTYYDPDRGYYFKLHLSDVTVDEATPLISKARKRFDVELVRRVTQDGFYKERIYVDDPSEVPDDKKVHQGPAGGVYYETGVQQVGTVDEPDTRNVAVIHWDDVELGDEIVYQTSEGEELFAEIIDIEEQDEQADVVIVEVGGQAERAVPGTYSVDDDSTEKAVTDHHMIWKEPAQNWVPYEGPRGGQGWRNPSTGDVVYQEEPPTGGPEGSDTEQMGDDPDFDPSEPPEGGYAPGWDGPPEGESDVWPGQAVEIFSDGAYQYGEIEAVGDGRARIDPDEGDEAIEVDLDEITAREDRDGSAVDTQPDPWDDVQRFEDDEVAQELIDTVNTEPGEGFTFKRNLEVDNPFERDVWFVGITSENLEAGEMEKEDVLDFYHEWLDLLEDEPALHIGGYAFEDGEKVSIDLSVAVEDAEEAEALGSAFNQESIANLYVAEEQGWDEGLIFTGGEGESPVDGPDDVREALSDIESLAKRLMLGKSKVFDHEKVYDVGGRRLTGTQIAYMALHGELDPREVEMSAVEEKSEGSLTSGTEGAHNAVYGGAELPDECRLCGNDRKEGSMLCEECEDKDATEKAELAKQFEADVYRIRPDPDDLGDFEEDDVLGVAVDFPNHDVYCDWNNEVFPDQLDEPHVSIYGTVDDLEQATGNETELVETYDVTKDCDGHHVGPYMENPSVRLEEGEVLCEEDGEVYDINSDIESAEPLGECPGCGDDLSHLVKADRPIIHTFEKNDGQWVSFVGPEGGEGWVNLMTGEKRYQKRRPGPGPEDVDEGEFAEGWDEPPEALDELEFGQAVEYRDHNDEFQMGEYEGVNDEGFHVVSPEGSDALHTVGEDLNNQITAVEEDYNRHDSWFEQEDSDYTAEQYWGAVQDEIPPDAAEELQPFEVGQEVALDLPGEDQPVSIPIYGFVDGDTDDFPASEDSLVFHYDDLEDAVGTETMRDRWGEPGDASPTITGPPGSVGQVVLGPADEHETQSDEPEGSDEGEEDQSWDEEQLGESEWLDQQDVEEGMPFNYEGQDVQVVGATSMTSEGDFSHAVVETDDGTTIPLHPNSIPDPIPEGPLAGLPQTASDDTPTHAYDTVDDVEIGDLPEGTPVIVGADGYYSAVETHPNNIGFDPGNGDTIYPEDVEIAAVHESAAEDLSEPEEPEADAQPPDEDETAEAVAEPASEDSDVHPAETEDYDLETYDPNDVEEFRDMSDIGASHGNSVAAMEVAVLPDGSKAVHKDVSHHSVNEDDIKRETAGYEAVKHFDDNVPTHTADLAAGWSVSEVVPGVDAKDATMEMKNAVDTEDFVDMAAKQVMIGNSDLHQNNVRVDEDGNLYPFDLDRAAGDLTSDWVGNLNHYDDTLDRILGELEKSANALGVSTGYGFRETVIERAAEIASEVDGPTMDLIHDDVSQVDEDFADTIRMNISRLANGEISP